MQQGSVERLGAFLTGAHADENGAQPGYYLSGKDNYAADSAAARKVMAGFPQARKLALANRGFLVRTVRSAFVADMDEPAAIVSAFADRTAPGSSLALSHITSVLSR